MIQENSLSVLAVVQSGGADTTFTLKRLLPQASILQDAAFSKLHAVIVICEMADPWPDMMKSLSDYRCWLFRSVSVKVKSIISPVKSSTDNRLLRGVIREGCLAVAGDTVISLRPLIGLRIFCNQIYLRQLCPVSRLHNR